jgi:hypothetical protein
MRWVILIATSLVLSGVGAVYYADTFPVYSHPDAPSLIEDQLSSLVLSYEKRSEQWYSRLSSYETPHKRNSDLGRALIAAGIALLVAGWLWLLYHHFARARQFWVVMSCWSLLWLVRIPFTVWYYQLRLHRFDYPSWGDTVLSLYSKSPLFGFSAR